MGGLKNSGAHFWFMFYVPKAQCFNQPPAGVRNGYSPPLYVLWEGLGFFLSFLWSIRDIHGWRWDIGWGGQSLWGDIEHSFPQALGWLILAHLLRVQLITIVGLERNFSSDQIGSDFRGFCLPLQCMGAGHMPGLFGSHTQSFPCCCKGHGHLSPASSLLVAHSGLVYCGL